MTERLVALEEANDQQWTLENALAAVGILRPVFLDGVDESPPIDTARLIGFLGDHLDEVDEDQWDLLLAAGPATGPSVQPVGHTMAAAAPEDHRMAYQQVAEQANEEFERLSGHRLGTPIHVALSDLAVPFDVYAATWVSGGSLDAFQFLFGHDGEAWEVMVDGVEDALDTSPQVCVIVLGTALTSWPADRQVAGMLHEMVHCHQHIVHPGGPKTFAEVDVDWMDEGYASWAGEAFAGGTLTSQRWWRRYFTGGVGSPPDGFTLFAGDYLAIDFYAMLAAGGIDPWANFVHWFGNLRANGIPDVARYRDMVTGLDTTLLAHWPASTTRNEVFGSPWNAPTGPGSSTTSAARRPASARASSEGRVLRADTVEQRYWAVEFTTAVDAPSIITISADGPATLRWEADGWDEQFIVTETLDRSWCVGEDCVCEDGTSPVPDALLAPIAAGDRPVLHSALFGADGRSLLVATVRTIEEECEEEEESAAIGPLDACLFGTWNPDPQQFRDYILTVYRTAGVSNLQLAGTIDLVFRDDGSFAQQYDDVRGSGSAGGTTARVRWSGESFGTWEATGGVLRLSFTGSNIRATVNGVEAQAPSMPASTVEAGYECGPALLEVAPPAGVPGPRWPLPTDWEKAT